MLRAHQRCTAKPEPTSPSSAAKLVGGGRSHGTFPPEPIRFVGAHIVRAAVVRRERAEIRDQRPSWLATRISALAPAGLEDKQ